MGLSLGHVHLGKGSFFSPRILNFNIVITFDSGMDRTLSPSFYANQQDEIIEITVKGFEIYVSGFLVRPSVCVVQAVCC